jgi:hypothetical protein
MARASHPRSRRNPQKIKLITICAILLLAVGWIIYFQFGPRGPAQASGARLEQINAQTAKEKQQLIEEQRQLHPGKPTDPVGA